jgi:hypothetical protein
MKLQGASILDLVTELLIRLDAQGKLEVLQQPLTLAAILEECGCEPVEVFTRLLGEDRVAALSMSPKAASGRGRS